MADERSGSAPSTVALTMVVVVLLAAVGFLAARTAPSTTSSGCATMSSSMSSNNGAASLVRNATTADYKLTLEISPPEQMLELCQYSTQTEGMVMLQVPMSNTSSSMSSSTQDYHVELHVYDIATGATVILPLSSVSISMTNSSGMATIFPIVEMFDAGQEPTTMHFGNNVDLSPGNYTVAVGVAGEQATFTVTLT